MKKHRLDTLAIITTIPLTLFSTGALSETVVGRWCDRMIPNMPRYNHIMEIVLTDEGKTELRSSFADGSSTVQELTEVNGGIYEMNDSASGDRYRIVPSDGSLQLLDNDGLVRVATRLENTPSSGECTN